MNKNLIRVLALLLIISPWIYVSSSYKEAGIIIIGVLILIATVNSKKKISKEVISN